MPLIELINDAVKDLIPSSELIFLSEVDRQVVIIPNKYSYSFLQAMKVDKNLKFDFLQDLCGVDFLGKGFQERYAIVYNLFSTIYKHSLRVKTFVSEETMTVNSVSDLWRSANWAEREAYDMYGIRFLNHPNLKRILLPDTFLNYPLRKEYPLRGKGERMSFDRVQ